MSQPSHSPNTLSVLHLISSLEVGGAEQLLLDYLDSAQSNPGLKLSAIVLNNVYHPRFLERFNQLNLSKACFMRKPSDKNPYFILKLMGFIIKNNVQLIHCHDPGSRNAAAICKLLLPFLKIVFTVHDTGIVPALNPFHRLVLANWVTSVIAISQAVQAECQAYGLKNTVLVYNGVSLERFSPKPKASPENRRLKLVQVARFNVYKKGQDLLLEALALCKAQGVGFKTQLVGMENAEVMNDLKALGQKIIDLDLSKDVELVLNQTNVTPFLQSADLFLLPSRNEGFGLVLIEAMATGLPCLASNLDGPRELIIPDKTGWLVDPNSANSIAEKLLIISKQSKQLEAMTSACLERAQTFSLNRMTEAYQRLYHQTLQGKNESHAA